MLCRLLQRYDRTMCLCCGWLMTTVRIITSVTQQVCPMPIYCVSRKLNYTFPSYSLPHCSGNVSIVISPHKGKHITDTVFHFAAIHADLAFSLSCRITVPGITRKLQQLRFSLPSLIAGMSILMFIINMTRVWLKILQRIRGYLQLQQLASTQVQEGPLHYHWLRYHGMVRHTL